MSRALDRLEGPPPPSSHRLQWLASCFLVLLLLPGCAPGGSTDDDDATADDDDDTAADDDDATADDDDGSPAEHDPGTDTCLELDGSGSWLRRLVEWRSEDGIEFTQHRLFQHCADVPSLAQSSDGTILTVFQSFQDPDDPAGWDKIGVRSSQDDGESWSELSIAEIEGLPTDVARPFDPTVTWDPAGQHWRLYFSLTLDGSTQLSDEVCTHSARSDDGLSFTYEADARFCIEGQPVIDPAVTQLDGTWYYSAPIGAPQDGAFFASSTDGLQFTRLEDIASDEHHRYTGNLAAVDGSLRFYGVEALYVDGNFLFWAGTTDEGESWSAPEPLNIPAGKDPGVLRLPGGDWILLVPTLPEDEG